MPESTSSIYKTVSWLLAILLFGAVALLVWYSHHQAGVLAEKETKIAGLSQDLAEKNDTLRRIDDLQKAFEQEKQTLTEQLATANRTNEELRGDLEASAAEHAETLAAEQEKARTAYAELEGRNQAAAERIEALEADFARLEQAMADAAETHEARIAEIETEQASRLAEAEAAHQEQQAAMDAAHASALRAREEALEAKIAEYRTALEGTDLEQAEQLAALQEGVEDRERAVEEAAGALAAIQEANERLGAQLADARQLVADRDQALMAVGDELEVANAKLAQEQSARSAFEKKHELAVAEATQRLEKLQQELRATEEAHDRTKTEAAAALRAAEEAKAAERLEAEGEITALTAELAARTADLESLRADHRAEVAALSDSLASAEEALATTRGELEATREAVRQAEETHRQALDEAESKIALLEQGLATERQAAAQELADCRREGLAAVDQERGFYADLSALGGRHTEQGILLSLAEEDLRFPVSRAELPTGELPSLDSIAGLLEEYPRLRARIEGHTDSGGREETNLELSQKRADAVKQALVDRGIEAERLVAEGIGEARPIADNATFAGRGKNRRVEIYVIAD